jgi:hypothetical protein
MQPQHRRFLRGSTLLLILIVAAFAVLWSLRYNITDAFLLYNYKPSNTVSELAMQTTMTDQGRHMFYINHPNVAERAQFNVSCKAYGEKTIVLGCYHSVQAGIYVFNVTDTRLNGVEQVTAAHEMLHAAYDRLSSSDRKQVDGWLLDYYQNDLQDKRIKDTIAAYKQSEPAEVVNEMHSVFGTEVANLPPNLENYYTRYFNRRSVVVSYEQRYEQEFANREDIIKQDDATLKDYKTQIDTENKQLYSMIASIKSQQSTLESEKSSSNIAAYNAGVAPYNAAIDDYNALASATTNLINEYNNLVKQRNDVAGEINQLAQAINSQPSAINNK